MLENELQWRVLTSFKESKKKHENLMLFISAVTQLLINVMETCQTQYTRL